MRDTFWLGAVLSNNVVIVWLEEHVEQLFMMKICIPLRSVQGRLVTMYGEGLALS